MIKTMGDVIRHHRDEKDWSLREFAKKLGDVSPAHISDIENGRRFPSEDLRRKMAKQLDVDASELESYDFRPHVDELRRMSDRDPAYGQALKKLAESNIRADELLAFVEKRQKKT